MTDTMVVICVTPLYNSRKKEYYFSIEMVNDKTGQYLETYAGQDYRNFKHWFPVIQNYTGIDTPVLEGQFHLKGGVTDRGALIVDADSQPKIVSTVNRQLYLNVYYQNFLA
jgi:hypothetical protein